MPFHPIYRDFILFLDELEDGKDPWEAYQRCYLCPNEAFLLAYWRTFRWMDLGQIEGRVRRIRRGDYAALEGLLAQESPEEIASEALGRCKSIVPAPKEPDVYLLVGFFSPDGFVMEFEGVPVIGFGLERFRDFRTLGILFAHEYCHWVRRLMEKGRGGSAKGYEGTPLGEVLLSEGSAAVFSQLAFPEKPLNEHLFLSRSRLNWCLENEVYLMERVRSELLSSRMASSLFGRGDEWMPPRVGNFVGYRWVKAYLSRFGTERIREVLLLGDVSDLEKAKGK